jgi:hypothetical protein
MGEPQSARPRPGRAHGGDVLMGKWATWRHMVEASKRESLEAVSHYNRPLADRGFEGFFVHMHTAWLYLLQAEFRQASTDIRYRDGKGHIDKVDGEPKCWDLTRCARERWPNPNDPVRANVDLTVRIRNKVEHRWTEGLSLLVAGRAQALVSNYEHELTEHFGERHSLGDSLRFPVFVGVLTRDGAIRLANEQARAGRGVRRLITDFEAGLDPATVEDPRYELRVHLIERTGPKSEADMVIDFIRDADLTDAQRDVMRQFGRDGKVMVRDVDRPVILPDWMLPKLTVERINAQLPFQFNMADFVAAWKKLQARPTSGDPNPKRTKSHYCVYDGPNANYIYSEAYVAYLVNRLDTEAKWKAFFGKAPTRKVRAIREAG